MLMKINRNHNLDIKKKLYTMLLKKEMINTVLKDIVNIPVINHQNGIH